MGMVYTGGGYDAMYILAEAWEKVGDPNNFDAVGDAIRNMNYRGINGTYKIDPDTNSGISYPNMTDDPEGGQAHLFFKVQNDEHRIIEPKKFEEVDFGLVIKLAKMALDIGIKDISVISSVMADKNSLNHYLKIKGEMEEEIKKLSFNKRN